MSERQPCPHCGRRVLVHPVSRRFKPHDDGTGQVLLIQGTPVRRYTRCAGSDQPSAGGVQ